MSPSTSPDRRHARRDSFDAVAETYADARPGYPAAVFRAIADVVPPPAEVLEVGPGPGVATLPLAELGYSVVGIELGAALARVARERLAHYPKVRILHADFESWRPDPPGTFDLVLGATSWHWVDPALSYAAAHRALRSGGWLALVANHPRPGRLGSPMRSFWEATGRLYRTHAPAILEGKHWSPRHLPYRSTDILRSGLFGPVRRLTWRWRRDLTAADYVALLNTYSDHRALSERRRRALLEAMRKLIDERFGGIAPREYWTHLHLAPRLSGAGT